MKKIGRVIAALSVLAMLFTTFSCANPVDPETAKKVIDDLNGDGEKDKEKEDSGEVVIGEKDDESGTSKVGIELKVTIPAHSQQYSIFRWDTAQSEDTNTEVYRMKNESDEPIEVTFFDRYGIFKNHTYKYCTENNWSGRSKWKYEVTAKEDGWQEPDIKIDPKAKFEDNSIVYTQKMELTYYEGESYDFAFMQAYVRENPWWMVEGAKEDEGPFFDYAFGFYPHYSGSEKKGKYNLIPDELRGLELTLTDQTLLIEIDENRVVEYIKHYAPDEFEFPQKIYAQNDVKENNDELCFTVPVPAGTHNVSLMKWDSDLNDYFEIASKPYPDETPLENAEQIILKDIFQHKAGEESHYFISYDGWKRYDGYDEGNREDRRGIVFTPKNNGRACRDLTNIAATYKENIITLTAEPIEKNDDDYWLIFDYCDADYPDNEKARVSIWFYKGIVKRGEKPDLLKANNALMDGQKLQLRTLRYNYHDKENGVDYHLALPIDNYEVPTEVTISKTTDTSKITSEDSIKFKIEIPKHTSGVCIQRREVDANGCKLTDFEEVAAQWPILNDKDNFDKDIARDFIDHYTVLKGHYYQYRVLLSDERWRVVSVRDYGIHLANKDGNPRPEFATVDKYPEIKLDLDAKGFHFLLKTNNNSYLETMDFKGGTIPNWITFNPAYSNGTQDVRPWVGAGKEDHLMPLEEYKDLPTGFYDLYEFAVDSQFEGDYFDARFFYNVEELNFDKIAGRIVRPADELENGGYSFNIQIPGWLGDFFDINVQRREKPSDDAVAYSWSEDLDLDKDSVGRLHANDDDERFNFDTWTLSFNDYYGYEKDKTYQTRALIRYRDYGDPNGELKIYEMPLGEITAKKNSWTAPVISKAPKFSWDDENQILAITNPNELNLNFANDELTKWGISDTKPLKWDIAISYRKDGTFDQDPPGLWCTYTIKPKYEPSIWGNRVQDWNNLGDTYTLKCYDCSVHLYVPGENITQVIPIDITDLAEAAKTLIR